MNSHVIGNDAEKSRMVENSVFGFCVMLIAFFSFINCFAFRSWDWWWSGFEYIDGARFKLEGRDGPFCSL